MKRIISRECYKICHSKRMRVSMLFLCLMAVFMYYYSTGQWEKKNVYVLLDETEEEREFFIHDGLIYQDIVDVIGAGRHIEHNAGDQGYLWMTPEALELFQENGALYEKYKEFHFPERMVLQQLVGGAIAPMEQEDFEPTWRLHKMLTDRSAAVWTAMIFAVLFFGMDFTNRGYQGALFHGQNRRQLFWGKYALFCLLYILLSVVEFILSIAAFAPKVELLPASYLIKSIFLRCLSDTGIAILCVPFVFWLKTEWKAFGAIFLTLFLFMTDLAVIYLDPYQFVTNEFWKTCSEMGTTFLIGLITIILFTASGVLSEKLFQRAELK